MSGSRALGSRAWYPVPRTTPAEVWPGTRDGAQQQLDAIAVSRDELLVRTAHFNSLVPRANTFVTSAARLSSMQALLGATDNESLAAALVTGMQEATTVAANYQDAFRSGSRSASEADLMPSEDNTLAEATDQVDAKARSLSTAYREFRVTQMQDMIAALTASGSEDRDRLAAIESTKRSIAQIAQTIDLAMAIVAPEGAATILSPTTSIEDAVKKQVTDAMPSVGGVIRFIADVAYDAEIRRINERLRSLDSLIASERAAINRQEYERRREAFTGALITYRNAQTALRNRIEARRRAYLELGERLDRFARVRGSSSGARVGAGQERFSTIFTLVSGVRETLALARWGNSVVDETGLGPAQLRAWYQSVTGSPQARRGGAPLARQRTDGRRGPDAQLHPAPGERLPGRDADGGPPVRPGRRGRRPVHGFAGAAARAGQR